MSGILVDHEEFNSFLFAIGHFPEGTPNRFELVAEFVRSQPREGNAPSPTVCLSSSKHGKTEKRLPLTEKTNCRTAFKLVQAKYPSLFQRDLNSRLFKNSGKSAFKPIMLLPFKTQCCGKNIKMDNRPSFPLVYTMNGTYVGALFHGQCDKCHTKYFPNYKIQSLVKESLLMYSRKGAVTSRYHQRLCLEHIFWKTFQTTFGWLEQLFNLAQKFTIWILRRKTLCVYLNSKNLPVQVMKNGN